jgi:predicted outer membrane repeat protein
MRYLLGFLMTLGVLGFVACGGDECAEPIGDVAGVWRMNSTVVIDDCGERENQTFRMAITRNGNGLTAVTPELEFNGTICGNQIRMSGSFPEDEGTVTVNATLDVSADGQSMEGSDTWTWTDGFESCSGSDSLSGTRIEPVDVFPCTEQGIRDAITLGGGPHTFTCAGPTTVVTEAEIVIDYDVILDGEGNLTIDGNEDHRVFSVAEGVEAELHGVSLTRGRSSFPARRGGGILNMGTLSVTNSTISGNNGTGINNWFEATLTLANTTVSDNTAGEAGGGIYNVGTLTVTNSTVSGNTARAGGGGIWSQGPLTMTDSAVSGNTSRPGAGGLFLAADSEATVTNSTVSGNSSQRTAPFINGNGGGISNSGTLTLTNSTVSGNTADDRGGGIYNVWTLTLVNSTLSGNTAPEGAGIHNEFGRTLTATNNAVDNECYIDGGVTTSRGYNIESPGDTCGFDQSTDMPGMSADDLRLGELTDNGGPTKTHALGAGSVAIDVISVEDCVDSEGAPLTTDQRGVARPQGDSCDVGAFELEVAAP